MAHKSGQICQTYKKDPKHKGTKFFRNVGNYLPTDTQKHRSKLESSTFNRPVYKLLAARHCSQVKIFETSLQSRFILQFWLQEKCSVLLCHEAWTATRNSWTVKCIFRKTTCIKLRKNSIHACSRRSHKQQYQEWLVNGFGCLLAIIRPTRGSTIIHEIIQLHKHCIISCIIEPHVGLLTANK